MTRVRLLAAIGLLTALAIAAGCGKRADPDAEPNPEPKPPSEAELKAAAVQRLKVISRASEDFQKANGDRFPVGIVGPKGQIGLSWRVAILPQLGEETLYKEFKLNESWDSEHNKKLIPRMPSVFTSPGKDAGEGKTYLRSFVGPLAFIPAPPSKKKGSPGYDYWAKVSPGALALAHQPGRTILDGTSYTLMVAEATEAIEWTNPNEIPFLDEYGERVFVVRKVSPTPKLGGVFEDGFHGLMCDGRVHFFPATLSEESLRAMITLAGGEVLGKDAEQIIWPGGSQFPTEQR